MSLGVQRADRVKENPRGAYMSESTASAMQTQHTHTPSPPSPSQSPGAPGRGTISRRAGEFLMQKGGDMCTHTHEHQNTSIKVHTPT